MSLDIRGVAQHIANHTGGGIKPSAGSYKVRCPAHDDKQASLNISPGRTQPVVLHCHANCEPDVILKEVGLTWADISHDLEPTEQRHTTDEWTPGGPAVAVYSYADERGELLFQVCRSADKGFFQRRPARPDDDLPPNRLWVWKMAGVRHVLYHLPDVLACVSAGNEVWIVEGEKDADNMRDRAGVCATTSPGGAGKWRDDYSQVLRDASVTIVADADETGRSHARQVRESLIAHGVGRVRIVESRHKKDATDHLDGGGTVADFLITNPYHREEKPKPALNIRDYLAQELPAQKAVIEGTLMRGERVLLTGYEGKGKSTFCKQVGYQVACGVHPFTGRQMEPRRVLIIDAENSTYDNYDDFNRLRYIASHHIRGEMDPDNLVIQEVDKIDVSKPEWVAWLVERVVAYDPDLLIIGPLYKLVGREIRDENDARLIINAIDTVRAVNGCAVLMEHHVPHGGPDGRDVRPIGSSLLLRWPNFGFGLKPLEGPDRQDLGLSMWASWRGARRRNRHWPEALRYGRGPAEWMWEPADPQEIADAKAQTVGGRW